MPAQKRFPTKYPGVHYIHGKWGEDKQQKIFLIRYRKNGLAIEEKVGRQREDGMTEAKASRIRAHRMSGTEPTNAERRRLGEEYGNRWTIGRLWTEYKLSKPNLKGIVTDENRYELHLKKHFSKKSPDEVTHEDVERLKRSLSKHVSDKTLANVLELLRRICNFGMKRNLCLGLQFVIELPKVNNIRTEDLNPDQLENLLMVLDQEKDIQAAAMIKLALYTGMRRGEMFRLKWQDLDFQRGFIKLVDPKGGKDSQVPMNDSALKLFRDHPRTESEYVFPGRKGDPRTDIKRALTRIKKATGLPDDFRILHGLRHVYASILASSGQVDMFHLQKLLNHQSPQMTQRYAHLRDEALKQASNVLVEQMNGISK